MVSVVVVVVLDEPGIEELLDDDGVLELLELVSPLALPLMELELEEPGGMELLLLEDPGVVVVVVSVELVLELGDDGVALVEDGDVVVVVVLLVPVLLRSQPVTAAVATASTATKGMSLFMTSPFECGWWVSDDSLSGRETAGVQRAGTRTTRAMAFAPVARGARGDSFPRSGKAFRARR